VTRRSRLRPLLAVCSLLAATAAVAVITSPGAGALTVIDVTTTVDGDPGSLRDAFAQADAASPDDAEIRLQAGAVYELTCDEGGALEHTEENVLEIVGNGATIRQTCEGERVITNIGDAGTLIVEHVWITGGDLPDGSAGGGIGASSSGLEVAYSTISGNSAGSGGGIFVTGGGDAVLINSTVADNVAVVNSGVGGIETQGTLTLVYSTVAGNTQASDSQAANVSTGGDLETFGSVIGDPIGPDPFDCSITGDTFSMGYNFSSDASCGLDDPTDLVGGDPGLAALADNGGGTPTRTPSATSPLIDHVALAECAFEEIDDDQRFVVRPQGAACDTGAVEREVTPDDDSSTGGSDQSDIVLRFTG